MSLFNLQERIDIVSISVCICMILLIVFSYGQKILKWRKPYLLCYYETDDSGSASKWSSSLYDALLVTK